MKIQDHLLTRPAEQIPWTGSAREIVPTSTIIHYTAGGTAAGAVETFQNGSFVAHIIIDRDGTIIQMLPFNRRGVHAGASEWTMSDGKKVQWFNNFSVGIELVNWGYLTERSPGVYASWAGTIVREEPFVGRHQNKHVPYMYWQPYTCKQLWACYRVVRLLTRHYKMNLILGHDEIAPMRKQDPGPAFPWAIFGTRKI